MPAKDNQDHGLSSHVIGTDLEAEHQCSDNIRPCDVIETIPKNTRDVFL